MKPALVLTLSLLLFAIFTKLPLAFSQVEQVLDSQGNPVFPSGQYNIVSTIRGAGGGGVKLGKTNNSECPVTLFQASSDLDNGLPVRFSFASEIGPQIIFTGTPLDIHFVWKPQCAESSKWVVVDDSPNAWVGIGGAQDHPGKQLIDGTFNIQKLGYGGYKLVFCPRISAPPGLCLDVGRKFDNDGTRLILTDKDPFRVEFRSADFVGIKSVV